MIYKIINILFVKKVIHLNTNLKVNDVCKYISDILCKL